MAMIEVGLEEFVDGLIAKKARDGAFDEAQRDRMKRELLTIADRAVDVAIMHAVLLDAIEGSTKKRIDRLHDLMQSGSKADTGRYLQRILPNVDEGIADELVKLEEMYLRGSFDDQSPRRAAADQEFLCRLTEVARRDPGEKKGTP